MKSRCVQRCLSYLLKVKESESPSVLTLCDPMDCGPPRSSVHGSFQARILEWVAFPPPGDLPNLGFAVMSPELQEDSLPIIPVLSDSKSYVQGKQGEILSWGQRRTE